MRSFTNAIERQANEPHPEALTSTIREVCGNVVQRVILALRLLQTPGFAQKLSLILSAVLVCSRALVDHVAQVYWFAEFRDFHCEDSHLVLLISRYHSFLWS